MEAIQKQFSRAKIVLVFAVLVAVFCSGCGLMDGLFGTVEDDADVGGLDAGPDADVSALHDAEEPDADAADDPDTDAAHDPDTDVADDPDTDATLDPDADATHDPDTDATLDPDADAEPDITECSQDTTFCGGECVDPMTNIEHCGGCDSPCAESQSCEQGLCEDLCDPGLTVCGPAQFCVDTDDNLDHCGGCGDRCATDVDGADIDCDGGQCVVLCSGEEIGEDDPVHCGACGTECDSGEVCSNGDCVAPCTEASDPFGGGDGSDGDPYRICSVDHLLNVTDEVDASFVLRDDLDLSSSVAIAPLDADSPDSFAGTFDGNGFAIIGLTVAVDGDNAGLFEHIASSGEVNDLILSDVDISGDSLVGALAATSDGEISGVTVDGGTVEGKNSVGGLMGRNSGTIADCTTDVAVEIDAEELSSDFDADGQYAGGLVGFLDGTVERSRAFGDVGGYSRVIGGLIGLVLSGTVDQSYATGDVDAVEVGGGLAGAVSEWGPGHPGEVTNSFATGDVGVSSNRGGGLTGLAMDGSIISNSYATGAIDGSFDVGGLIGRRDDADVDHSYWDEDTAGVSQGVGGGDSDGVEAMPTGDFDTSDNFDEWNFGDVWTIGISPDGNSRPILQWAEEL